MVTLVACKLHTGHDIHIKHVVDKYDCSGIERTMYQNALALPILTLILVSPLESADAVLSLPSISCWLYRITS